MPKYLPIVIAALATSAVLNAQAPVPAQYQDLYSMLDRQISAFEAQISARWDGSMPPVDFSGELVTANGGRGLQLTDPRQMQGVLLELERLRSLGVRAVSITIGFPLLHRPFHVWNGNADNYDKLAAFYRDLAGNVRQRGLRLVIKSGLLFPGFYSAGSGLDVGRYYSSLSADQYIAARAAMAGEVARLMQPDYILLGAEPDVEAELANKSAIATVAGYQGLMSRAISAVRESGTGDRILLGAGVGTWEPNGIAYINALAGTGLDFIDLHIYPVNGRALDNAIAFAEEARRRGKPVAISEAWLLKQRDSEFSVINVANNPVIFARDAFSFWEPLDSRFLAALARFAYWQEALMISPFWTRYFYAYLNYADVSALPPDQIIARQLEQTVAALVSNSFTPSGLQYQRFVTPGGSRASTVSAAALEQNRPIASDSLISLFGLNLAATTASATALPLPETLAGTEVRVTDSSGTTRVAPLLYVSPAQVNVLVPSNLAAGQATIVVRSPSRDTTVGKETKSISTVQLNAAAPGLFSANSSGRGPAAAYVQRVRGGTASQSELVFECAGAGNCVVKPVDLGPDSDRVILTLFGTGFRRSLETARVTIGGVVVIPEYIGDQRQFAGLDQVNVTIPRTLAGRGTVDVQVSVGGMTSNTVVISIR
jgi:uncharacterized protein (TIGR03437 family)